MSKNFKYKGLDFEIFDKHMEFSINFTIKERFEKGIYEKEEIDLIQKYVEQDDTVLELGSSLGVTSCIIATKLSNKGSLVALEANPNLIENIERNRKINNCNFILKNAVASHNNREVEFNFNGLSHSGSIIKKTHLIGEDKEKKYGKYTNIKSTTVTPLDIEKEYNKKFNVLVCDIEGEEYDLLYHCFDYFKNFDKIIIEFHPHLSKSKYNLETLNDLYSKYFKIIHKDRIGTFIKK